MTPPRPNGSSRRVGAALVAGGVAAAAMAGETDRPAALLVLLVAQAGLGRGGELSLLNIP